MILRDVSFLIFSPCASLPLRFALRPSLPAQLPVMPGTSPSCSRSRRGRVSGVAIATADVRTSNGAEMSQELKNRTKKFALDAIGLCAALPHLPETRHAINQLIRSSSSVAANYRSACRGKSKADFIAKLGIVEEEAGESGFWLEMLRDVCELLSANSEPRTHIHSVAHGRKFGIQN